MSARTDLATYLVETLPDTWRVIDHDENPTINRTTVMTYVSRVEAGATFARWSTTIDVVLMTPKQTDADDDLEAALTLLLEALDQQEFTEWSVAERSIWNDTYPAYKVTTAIDTQKIYTED